MQNRPKRISIIGAGQVGGSLGKGWSRAGYEIVFGVSNPKDKKHHAAAEAAGQAAIASNAEAVAEADVVVLAVPWDAVPKAIDSCGTLEGKILLDATNPLAFGSEGLELVIGHSTSGGEEVARLAQGAFVFKTMNQVGFAVMSEANGYPTRPVMFVAGDSAEHKPQVLQLVGDLGFEAIDAGRLKQARLLEPFAMLWIDQVVTHGAPANNAFAFMQKRETP